MPSLDPKYKSPFLNAMLRLSSKSGIYPKIFVQNSVTIESSNPLTAGQFGDVWKGTFQDQQVAIKILRLYTTSDVSQHVKVGFNILYSDYCPNIFIRKFFGKRLFGDSSVTPMFCRFSVFIIQRMIHRDSASFLHGCAMATFGSFCGVSEAKIN